MYFCLDLENVTAAAEDWLGHWAFDYGAEGISEILSFHQEEGEEEVATVETDLHHLHVYFLKVPDNTFVQEMLSRFPEIKWTLSEESDQDWLAEWKKGFQAFNLVDGIYVVPSWLKPPAEAKQVVWMEPGMAFGTGTHETTQLTSEAIAKYDPAGKTVLDVGTGTGILAILAKRLGATKAVGIDTDPEALRVAKENAQKNETQIDVMERTLTYVPGSYEMVVANIIDGILIRIQDDLFRKVAPGGELILSGILAEREEHFLSHFHLPKGAEWVERTQKGDWTCRVAHFQRPAQRPAQRPV
jgi:ribosomal protein L11 methyltransferase